MSAADINTLYQQMGEMLTSLRALGAMIEMRDEQSSKLQDLVRADLSTLRQDQRDLEEKLDCVTCVMQHDMLGLRTDVADGARSINDLVRAVQELRSPVAEIVALRSRAAGVILGIGVFGSAVLWLAEPLYRWIVEHNYLKP
jgi:hypothetical protein